jgi:uncharacterized membrane protein YphA (DoxX/SURF4 family)
MKVDSLVRVLRTGFTPGLTMVVRVGLGCMFIYSSLPKIRQPYDFLSSVYGFELIGPKLGLLVSMALPWMELLVGICLVGDVFVSGALLASASMAAMFTFVLASALHRGLDISCGCFSTSVANKVSYFTVMRAVAILLVSMGAYLSVVFLPQRTERADRRESI